MDITFNVKNVDKEKLKIDFDNGLKIESIGFNKTDSIVAIKKAIYTIYPRISIIYNYEYYDDYFVVDSSALVNIYKGEEKSSAPFYTKGNINVSPIFDTVSNKIYRELKKGQIKELEKFSNLIVELSKSKATDDSSKSELTQLAKEINDKSMKFLTSYSTDFFSFYYFADQILPISTAYMVNDPLYYQQLLTYYNTVFPEEFKNTAEGKDIAMQLQRKISPLASTLFKEGDILPDIDINDIYGNIVSFKNQKEEFVLIDFWASWCSPCIQQVPDLKSLRNEFSEDKLKMVGISIDSDSTAFIQSVNDHEMNWIHALDKTNILDRTLNIHSVPATFLLDRKGKILYAQRGGKLNLTRIKKILTTE